MTWCQVIYLLVLEVIQVRDCWDIVNQRRAGGFVGQEAFPGRKVSLSKIERKFFCFMIYSLFDDVGGVLSPGRYAGN